MQNILNKVFEYNSIVFDIENAPEWDTLNIPTELIEKRNKMEYEIYKAILEYAIEQNLTKKPVSIIISNIHNEYFKIPDQLVNVHNFKTYLIYLLGK
jgi:hypothetical protein